MMEDPHTQRILFTVLNETMEEGHRKAVVEHALNHRREAPTGLRQRLERVIRERLRIPGFHRDATKAPTWLLVDGIMALTHRSSELMGVVLQVWTATQPEFKTAVRQFLEGRDIPVSDEEDLQRGFPGRWPVEEVERLAGEYLAEDPEYARPDIVLMLCCLTGRAPWPEGLDMEEEPEETGEETADGGEDDSVNLERWLDALRTLPADASEWEGVDRFVESVQRLAAEKAREQEGRGRLREELAALTGQCAEEVGFFDLSAVSTWTVGTAPRDTAERLSAKVRELREGLIEYRSLRQQRGSTFQEERELQERRTSLEDRILASYRDLASAFVPSFPPLPPPETGTPEPETAETRKEGSGDRVSAPPAGETAPESQSPNEDVRTSILSEVRQEVPESLEGPETPDVVATVPVEITPVVHSFPTSSEKAPSIDAPKGQEKEVPEIEIEADSSLEVALALRSEDRKEYWHAFLWTLIQENDLSGAYWLARSLEALEGFSPAPSWLLRAAQAARWLRGNTDPLASDMLDIARSHQPDSSEEQKLLGLAVALHAVLIAPGSGVIDWLVAPPSCPFLHKIVSVVKTFANTGKALHPEDVHGVAGATQHEDKITRISDDARRWLEETPRKKIKLPRATDVLRHLVGPHGDIHVLLHPVTRDVRSESANVRELLEPWRDREWIIQQVDEIDKRHSRVKAKQIIGDPRDQIIRYVTEACNLALDWCELVDRKRAFEREGDWWFGQVGALRTGVREGLPESVNGLEALNRASSSRSVSAASRCLMRTIDQLSRTLSLPQVAGESDRGVELPWAQLPAEADTLTAALSRRLLWLPEVPLDHAGQPQEREEYRIREALRDATAGNCTLQVAFGKWLEKRDFRFMELLLKDVREEEALPELSRRYQVELEGCRAALREDASKTVTVIEQAVVDGIIGAERSKFIAEVEAIHSAETLDFAPKFEKLLQIRNELEVARQVRLEELRRNWVELQPRLEAHLQLSVWEKVRGFVQDALHQGGTRVVEESLSHLRRVFEEGREIEENWFSPPKKRDVLRDFKDRAQEIETWLENERDLQAVARGIQRGSTQAGMGYGKIQKPRREEAAQAIDAWRRLKGRGARNDNLRLIQVVLRYLGFIFDSSVELPVRLKRDDRDWLHVEALMSASDLARPIPQFGSQAEGSYNVVCLWERPGMDTMSAWLRELRLDTHSVVVLYLGRLTVRQRHDLTFSSRARELTVALLDEVLLTFLAGEQDVRLPAFLRCALPFAAVHPYTPFQAGDVPSEMFYGREEMVRELQRLSGSCLVYGGRQLGKSALLRHVQREFHHPERGQYARVEDIKLIGDPQAGQPTDAVWSRLRDGFKSLGLLSARMTTDRPEEIARHIERVFREKKCQVIVLFDEADHFLDMDARNRFRVVEDLRTLMVNTERRLKVVFAGLHNVQRFQGIPNQPLAHFGTPLCVGPLEPAAAQQLVREPLEVLGFRFPDNATVLRVLSYTNYHPGLIQLFCHHLLKRLYTRIEGRLAPHDVSPDDVEDLYRDPEVHERIRERLNWTIALDPRYQAIAWSMIYDQMGMRDSYAQAYPPAGILELVRGGWPQGFREAGTDQIRSLLDEMCGLGVLVRNTDGHYRLRSPNLVRLMGTDEDIENRLIELSEKEQEVEFDADSHHAPLDEGASRYSPLTHSLARSLNSQRFGVGLVFASEALGLSQVVSSFQRFIPPGLPDEVQANCAEIPGDIRTESLTRAWLEDYLHAHGGYERLVVYQTLVGNGEELAERVQAGLDLCRRRERSQRQWLRVLFLFDPGAAWRWLSLPTQKREELETRADSTVYVRRWNLRGIHQRLAQRGLMNTDEVCRKVLEATGGWPLLLDAVFDRCVAQDDPRLCALEIRDGFSNLESPLVSTFRAGLGIEENSPAHQVLKVLKQWGESVPVEMVTEESGLSLEACASVVEYLTRLGCVTVQDGGVSVEPIVGRLF